MRCWHCKGDHESVTQVKVCAGVLGAGALLTEPRYGAGEGFTLEQAQAALQQAMTEVVSTIADPEPLPEITEGMWRLDDGTIYKVQRAVHGSGQLYGKRLCTGQAGVTDETPAVWFEYEPNAVRMLALNRAHKLTLDEAKEFGALYGTCCICGRTLTNETSIEAGIGPHCAGRLSA